jgi:hypothetical protein
MTESTKDHTRRRSDNRPAWWLEQSKSEYQHGYPDASEAEIKQLMDAEEILRHPPKSLKEAQAVLASMPRP